MPEEEPSLRHSTGCLASVETGICITIPMLDVVFTYEENPQSNYFDM